jgi:hypothetical protein
MAKNLWFIVGTVVIVFVGAFIAQPAVVQWLGKHPIYDALITAAGVAFHAVNTYLPKAAAPNTMNPNTATKTS